MNRTFGVLFMVTFILLGCNDTSTDSSSENPSLTPEEQQSETNSEQTSPSDNTSSETEQNTETNQSYNGYEPKDELEDRYFEKIAKMNSWNSFELDYEYKTFLQNEADIQEETSIEAKYVLNPFHLHRTFHSIYVRDDYIETYIFPDAGYRNSQMQGWEIEDDYASYQVNPLPSRSDLFYALIQKSNGIVESGDGRVNVDILEENFEEAYEMIQLAFHHNISVKSSEYESAVTQYAIPLNDLEGIAVEFTFSNSTIEEVSIIISYNRSDVESVDQIHIEESYEDINEFETIDIPEEILKEVGA